MIFRELEELISRAEQLGTDVGSWPNYAIDPFGNTENITNMIKLANEKRDRWAKHVYETGWGWVSSRSLVPGIPIRIMAHGIGMVVSVEILHGQHHLSDNRSFIGPRVFDKKAYPKDSVIRIGCIFRYAEPLCMDDPANGPTGAFVDVRFLLDSISAA